MRTTSATLAVLSLAAVTLTGCSSVAFDGQSCVRADSTSGIDDAVTVSGAFGEKPDVELFTPLKAERTSFTDIITGDDGAPLTAAGQLAVVEMSLYDGSTGEYVVGTEFTGDLSRLSNIASWSSQMPGIGSVLECATPGTRMVAAVAPEDFGEAALSGFGMAPDTTVVAVIDVLETMYPSATGSSVFNAQRGLPTVVRATDGRPGIIVPDGTAPTETVTQTLIDGDGAVPADDELVWVHYTAVRWSDREVATSTWDADPTAGLEGIAPEVAEAVDGARIGSQLMVVVPSETETMVYVVDVLGSSPSTVS